MMDKNIIFCIINTPFSIEENDYTILFTREGCDYIDYNIREEYNFSKITKALNKKGYIEIDILKFEYTGMSINNRPTKKDLISTLEIIGIVYEENFEKHMQKEVEKASSMINPDLIKKILQTSSFNSNTEKNSLETTMLALEDASRMSEIKLNKKRKRTIIPSIGKEIELSFYLFFEFIYNDQIKDFLIDINGSFSLDDELQNKYKNFIKITTEKFERFENETISNNRTLFFRTKKTKLDFLNEVSFLYEVIVDIIIKTNAKNDHKMKLDNKEFYFDLFDIRKKVNLDSKIIISLDMTDYENLLVFSDKIQNEKAKQHEKTIDFIEIKNVCKEIEDSLMSRMLKSADEDDFKEAALLKNNIQIVKNKINFFNKNHKKGNISLEEYHNYFNLS